MHYNNLNNSSIDGEIWKGIDFTENLYEISNLGRIRSTNYLITTIFGSYYNKGRVLKQQLANCGELTVNFGCAQLNLIRKPYLVNRLVAKAFIPNPHLMPLAIHISGNNLDNRADNIQWATHIENVNKKTCIERMRKSLKEVKKGTMPSENFLNNHHIGLKKSQETRRRGVIISKNSQFIEFNTVKEAIDYIGCATGAIHRAINNRKDKDKATVYGYSVKFTN